jgi:hypothetical protein
MSYEKEEPPITFTDGNTLKKRFKFLLCSDFKYRKAVLSRARMKTDRIRTDITDIVFVFIFMFGFGFEYG